MTTIFVLASSRNAHGMSLTKFESTQSNGWRPSPSRSHKDRTGGSRHTATPECRTATRTCIGQGVQDGDDPLAHRALLKKPATCADPSKLSLQTEITTASSVYKPVY